MKRKSERGTSRGMPSLSDRAQLRSPLEWGVMDVLAIALLACAVLVLVGPGGPRVGPGLGSEARAGRARARRKRKLRVVGGERDEDFVASVQRDLEDLPVVEERDDRQPR